MISLVQTEKTARGLSDRIYERRKNAAIDIQRAVEAFAAKVLKAGYASPVRTPRGRDILAACGQLKSASERSRRQRTGTGKSVAALGADAT